MFTFGNNQQRVAKCFTWMFSVSTDTLLQAKLPSCTCFVICILFVFSLNAHFQGYSFNNYFYILLIFEIFQSSVGAVCLYHLLKLCLLASIHIHE